MVRTSAVALALWPAAAAVRSAGPQTAEISTVVDLFYDHDFDRARPAVAGLAARYPGHPAGPLFQAIVDYQRWVALGLRDDGSWDEVDRQLSLAVSCAKTLEKTAPAQSHYYQGAALGFRARGLAARRRFVRALPDAASALRHLKTALELDPSLQDARLGLGMYHYFAARMPAAAKPFARLLVGESGDRDLGLQELWTVANSSGAARMEARAVLSMILSKSDEADWDGAEKLLAELTARYPHNPVHRLRRAYVAERRGALDQALALSDPDGGWIRALNPAARDNARAWALYRAAEVRLFQDKIDEAGRRLAAVDERRAPKGLADWIALRRGNLADARGDRLAARALYAKVKDKNAAPLAKRFADEPFPAGPRDPAPFFSGY